MIEHHYIYVERTALVGFNSNFKNRVCVRERERACSEVVVGKWD